MTMKPMRTVIAATVLAVGMSAGAAMAAPAFPGGGFTDTFEEDSGFAIFGFNIAFAGNTPAAVKHFVAGLNATQKRSVQIGCNAVLRDPSLAQSATVFDFCRNYRS
jgi:hypothetical protein